MGLVWKDKNSHYQGVRIKRSQGYQISELGKCGFRLLILKILYLKLITFAYGIENRLLFFDP